MMNLKELITYRTILEKINGIDGKAIERSIFDELNAVNRRINSSYVDILNIKETMYNKQQTILENLTGMYDDLNRLLEEVDKQIILQEDQYHSKSYKVREADWAKTPESKEHERKFGELARRPSYLPFGMLEPKERFIGICKKFVDFKYPGLELGPVTGDIAQELVALDPLYLADNTIDRLQAMKKLWNRIFQKRVRYYELNDDDNAPLDVFPHNQIGFIGSWNWFNYKPYDVIQRYLNSAHTVLRPGGTMIFTYNNCSYPEAVDKVDKMQYSYVNGNALKKYCKSLGFEITSSFDGEKEIDWCLSWLEIKKPGKLTSLRGGQNLGAINRLWNGDNE